MTVGEVVKRWALLSERCNTMTREGVFSPSAESEGGRRLYTDKDLVKLHQILSLKSLGFLSGGYKKRLIPLDTPEDVAKVLEEQGPTASQEN